LPRQRYATMGLKPAILAKLQKDTDKIYPGRLLPNALIIMMMNDVKSGYILLKWTIPMLILPACAHH
jgi:hypothetical protein